MVENVDEPQVRSQRWGKTSTLTILEDIAKAREKAKAPITYRPVVTELELVALKEGSTPEMAEWWDANSVVITPMVATMEFEVTVDDQDNLRAMFLGKEDSHATGKKESSTPLNRADRRRIRNRKTG